MVVNMPESLKLYFLENHLFAKFDSGRIWLLDTGAPTSFGMRSVNIGGRDFELQMDYMGMSAEKLSEYVGVECSGLLGMDILGEFDHLWDLREGVWEVSEHTESCNGVTVELDEFMSIPICSAEVNGVKRRLFFDTGAKISYLVPQLTEGSTSVGEERDFYPGFGEFMTQVYEMPLKMGGTDRLMSFGVLPPLLGPTLSMAGVEGILGNEILSGRKILFSPRKKTLCIN